MFRKEGEITNFNKHTERGYTRINTESTNTFNGSHQHQHQRSRFKEFRNNENKRQEISQEEYNEKYGFAKLEINLLEQENIIVSEEAVADEKSSFDDISGRNGAEGLKEDLLCGIYSCGFDFPSKIQGLAIPQII
jgi:hypothetical protein